ncbi:hypothetical protein RI367_006996 [Sorochytrium milnesiophthora]
MESKQVVVVVGATGTQGGSVARELLSRSKFAVRALTRNPQSPKARKLADNGAEVIVCDIDRRKDLERAFTGAYAVFAMTDGTDDKAIAQRGRSYETEQGNLMADIAKQVGIKHYIWCSLDDIKEMSGGRLPNWAPRTAKHAVEKHIRSIGLPATMYYAGWFLENISQQTYPLLPDDETGNRWVYRSGVVPDRKQPFLDATGDTGKIVAAILDNPQMLIGGRVDGISEWLTLDELCMVLSKITGKVVRYEFDSRLTTSAFWADKRPALHYVNELFQCMNEYGYYGNHDSSLTPRLVPNLNTAEQHFRRINFSVKQKE